MSVIDGRLAERMSHVGLSPTMKGTIEAERLRRQGVDVVDLGAGEPDFPTPAHVTAAAHAALDKNFAGLFPVFDWLFGTLYMPRDHRATVFGTVDRAVPAGFLRQLSYPLRKAPVQSSAPAPA